MSDKAEIEVGSVVKIERHKDGWVATVTGPNNSDHAGRFFKTHKTFDDAVQDIKNLLETG